MAELPTLPDPFTSLPLKGSQTTSINVWSSDQMQAYAREALASLTARAEAAEADARRWRWLRSCEGWPDSEAGVMGYTPEEFDAMADAAQHTGEPK